MKKKYLIVVDMQKDFVDGALGTEQAQQIVAGVVQKVQQFDGEMIFTRDTHFADYLSTSEGRLLPVEHCIKDTEGWNIVEELDKIRREKECRVYDKITFGCKELAQDMGKLYEEDQVASIELVGLCTDICVVSNALLLKAFLPEVEIAVDAACCAGVTPDKHQAALETMRSCQILVQ